ncbi:MAG: cyclic-di-AMP receptor [Anaerolineae bacterium]
MDPKIDRMAIAIVYKTQSAELLAALNASGIPVTVIDASGGFLQEAMVTFVAGMPQGRLPFFFSLVREHCPVHTRYVTVGIELTDEYPFTPIEVRVGGATVFVVPVEEFIQL